MEWHTVNGDKDDKKVKLFALSTCGHCRNTRMLLEDLGVKYDYSYVDKTSGDERAEAVDELSKWNEAVSFPTMVIDDDVVIVGHNEDEIRENFE